MKRDAAERIYWRHSTSPTFFFNSLIKIEMHRPSISSSARFSFVFFATKVKETDK
jgi:hypothetical protein